MVEHLHEVNRCRGLFATHYHELTALAARLDPLRLPHACGSRNGRAKWSSCTRWQTGAADRSYGVHVARLAGLPEAVLARAEEVLHQLEQGEAAAPPASPTTCRCSPPPRRGRAAQPRQPHPPRHPDWS